MTTTHRLSRRGFLKAGASLAALTDLGRVGQARATTATDYKALVCIYLAGGHDGNNLVIPLDPVRQTYYKAARGALAIAPSNLAATGFFAGTDPYALHPALPRLHARYQAGQAALVLNMGNLLGPLNRAGFLGNQPAPANLFSHSDQGVAIQVGVPRVDSTGWGGRLLDCVSAGANNQAALSTAGMAPFLVSRQDAGNVVPPNTDLRLAALNPWPPSLAAARRSALLSLLALDGESPLRLAANQALGDGVQLADDLAALTALPWSTPFPKTRLGTQLETIANLMDLRRHTAGRQVFIATLGGFDTHSGQTWQLGDLFGQLDAALDAFYRATQELGLEQSVASFTLSEFGRTLQSNGDGSDHAWGNHQVVLGGAVQGGLYGTLPDLRLGQGDDANNRGVWIPRQSTEQFGATLGRWFGASEEALAWAFPSLGAFPVQDLGFI